MGVIFQHSAIENVKVIAEPLIAIRAGNATWSARTFEIWAIKWPELIWSFPDFSDTAKQAVCLREQWRRFKFLFSHRAMGTYSLTEFHEHLSSKTKGLARAKAYVAGAIPGKVANLIVVFYYLLFKRSSRLALYDILCSRYATWPSRLFARSLGMKVCREK